MSPPKKSRGGLIAIISIIVVVLIIVGVVATIALTGKKPKNTSANNSSSTPTTAVTPTSSVPAGFQQFSNSQFSIDYPSDWTAKAASSNTGEDFTGPSAQVFQIDVQPQADATQVPVFLNAFCSVLGKPIGSPTVVTIGGVQWQQETCGSNGVPIGTVEATVHQGQLFSIAYISLASDFTSDTTQFYKPMEQTFAFAG